MILHRLLFIFKFNLKKSNSFPMQPLWKYVNNLKQMVLIHVTTAALIRWPA